MARKAKKPEETERIAKEAGKPKGPIKYQLELNEEQREAKALIYNNAITILTGKAGSGKTLAAVITGLDMVFKKEIKKIYITRPVVTREDIGFLPGDIASKLDPFLVPIYDNLKRCYNEEKINQLIENKVIEIAPISFMRGRTIEDGILIIDEAQNIDHESFKMCLTRIGRNGKVVACGDSAQIDLKKKNFSGLEFLVSIAGKVPSMAHLDLKSNHRNEIVEHILKQYEEKDAAEKAAEAANKKKK
jgi:phosphate starvation-inducible PhoH-like protein